jgi:HK97 family phage major capsid protein
MDSPRQSEARAEHKRIVEQLRALHGKAEAENRGFTPAERSMFDDLCAKADAQARVVEDLRQIDERMAAFFPRPAGDPGERPQPGTSAEIRSGADWTKTFGSGDADERGLTWADYLRGIARMRTSEAATRSLSVGVDSAGGFTVPHLLMPDLLDALWPASALLTAGAGFTAVDDGAKTYNFPGLDALPVAGWRNEAGAIADSPPTFRNVQAVPRSLAVQFRISRELLADGQGIDAALREALARSMAVAIDAAGLRGSGTAPTPRGILHTPGIHSITNGANGASLSTIRWSNLLSATQAILGANAPRPNAVIMSPRTLVGFASLADSTNQPLQRPDMLAGMSFVATSQVPNNLTVGTSNDCSEAYVGRFDDVRFVLRERPSVQLLVETHAATGQIGFICHARLDVAVLYPTALAVVTGIRP